MGERLYDAQRAFILAQRENCERSKPLRRHSCERTAAHYCCSFSSLCLVTRTLDASAQDIGDWLSIPHRLVYVMVMGGGKLAHAFVLHRRKHRVTIISSSYRKICARDFLDHGRGWIRPWTEDRPSEVDVDTIVDAFRDGSIREVHTSWPATPRYTVAVFEHSPRRDRLRRFELTQTPMRTLHVCRRLIMMQILWGIASLRHALLFLTASASLKVGRPCDLFDPELDSEDYGVNMCDIYDSPPPTDALALARRACGTYGVVCSVRRVDNPATDDESILWVVEASDQLLSVLDGRARKWTDATGWTDASAFPFSATCIGFSPTGSSP